MTPSNLHHLINVFPGGLTYVGHPLACIFWVASINAYKKENIVQHVAKTGEIAMGLLAELARKHLCIGKVRGRGLFIGIELMKDHKI